jgi:glycosyltransferase involved in cell wall biosynthesis
MRKSIFVFAEYFRGLNQSGLTGGTIAFYEAVSALSQVFDMRIFSFDPAPVPENLGELSSRTVYLPALKSRGLRLIADWNPLLRRAYEEAIKDYGEPDAIVAVSDTLPLLALPETRNIKRVAVIQAYENFGIFCPQGSLTERLSGLKVSLKTRMKSRKAIQTADLVIVNSQYVNRIVQSHFGTSRTTVIYPPLSAMFNDAVTRATAPSPFTVGFVTRNSGKNLTFVIALAETMPGVVFKVFGHSTVAQTHPTNLEFKGWSADRRNMFCQASVWIVPSKWPEPFGMVSVEAQASGRSVFVSNLGGLSETVPSPDYVISCFDKGLWAHRIEQAFERPQITDTDFLANFQSDRISNQWLSTFSDLLS